MTFFNINQGLRSIPSEALVSGEPYSFYLHSLIEHNQELIDRTILSRQLVNDYLPNVSGVAHSEIATPSGGLLAQWGRFEARSNVELVAKIFAAKNAATYSDNTDIHLISTPKLLHPSVTLDSIVTSYAGAAVYYDYSTVNSTSYAYYELKIKPNAANGQFFYLSLMKSSVDSVDNSEIFIRLISIYEQPEGV
jgi:hypothetical protein